MESKKYPLLTQISAWRVDRRADDWRARQPIQPGEEPTYGGFYTQEQIKEIVAYAGARGIEVIPEIELPGHSSEIFAAYPNLSCTGKKQDVTPGGYYKDLQTCFCAGNEDVFKFLEDILEETMALFPSKYIHIGADEVNKSFWKKCPKCQQRMVDEHLANVEELQSYFVKRMEKFINSKGKNLIGWDEIIEGGLAPNATVMSWRGIGGGIEGAKSGHDVIMTPETFLYYDYYQDLPDKEPVAIGGLNTVKSTYDFDPIPAALNKMEAQRILGAQANVWSEWILTFDHVQYMVLPRMSALSEVVWSPKKSRNYIDFSKRLETQRARFLAMGVNAHPRTSLIDIQAKKSWRGFTVSMTPETYQAQIRYTLDGSEPTLKSPKYRKPLHVKKVTVIKAKAFSKSWQDAPTFTRVFGKHLAYGKAVTMVSPSTSRHSALPEQLVDGLTAPYRYADQGYQCVYGKDFEAIIDLKESKQIKQITGSFLYYAPNRVHPPKVMNVFVSENGTDYVKVDSVIRVFDPFSCKSSKELLEIKTPCVGRYIKVIGVNEIIPEGLVGAGKMPGIFCDEIFVR
jgi:hexosaminidase